MFLSMVNQLLENSLSADVVLLLEKEVLGERGTGKARHSEMV